MPCLLRSTLLTSGLPSLRLRAKSTSIRTVIARTSAKAYMGPSTHAEVHLRVQGLHWLSRLLRVLGLMIQLAIVDLPSFPTLIAVFQMARSWQVSFSCHMSITELRGGWCYQQWRLCQAFHWAMREIWGRRWRVRCLQRKSLSVSFDLRGSMTDRDLQ